jgi:hypothetical protein
LWPQEFSLEGWGYFELIIFASILIRPSFSSSSRMESCSDSLCLVHRLRSFFFILPRVAAPIGLSILLFAASEVDTSNQN